MGPTAGGAVYSPALTDWVFMVKKSSSMYITGPEVIKAVIGEEVSQEELGGAVAHATKSGVCHFATESDEDCLAKIRTLLSFLPDSCHSPLPIVSATDNPDRECPELDAIIPDRANRAYDMKKVIAAVADGGEMFEPHELWAKNMVVAFIRIMGRPVGVIANNPKFNAGVLDVAASDKASRFIRFCDAFNIPLLTFADVPGYMPGTQQEWAGIITHGAKLLHAYSEATVPKITVVTRKDYGGAYIAMCSKHLGADYVMAWPTAEIAVMGAEGACNIIYRREIAEAPDPAARRAELVRLLRGAVQQPLLRRGPRRPSTRSSGRKRRAGGSPSSLRRSRTRRKRDSRRSTTTSPCEGVLPWLFLLGFGKNRHECIHHQESGRLFPLVRMLIHILHDDVTDLRYGHVFRAVPQHTQQCILYTKNIDSICPRVRRIGRWGLDRCGELLSR